MDDHEVKCPEPITHLTSSASQIFALGQSGVLYRVENGELVEVPMPSRLKAICSAQRVLTVITTDDKIFDYWCSGHSELKQRYLQSTLKLDSVCGVATKFSLCGSRYVIWDRHNLYWNNSRGGLSHERVDGCIKSCVIDDVDDVVVLMTSGKLMMIKDDCCGEIECTDSVVGLTVVMDENMLIPSYITDDGQIRTIANNVDYCTELSATLGNCPNLPPCIITKSANKRA